MIPADWTPHRRDDGEVLGWIRPSGERWVAVDRLGREASGALEWLEAEAVLEWLEAEAVLDERGLGWLAERWLLDGEPVRIAEVTGERIVVLGDEYGAASAVGGTPRRIELPWPAPEGLRLSPRP